MEIQENKYTMKLTL